MRLRSRKFQKLALGMPGAILAAIVLLPVATLAIRLAFDRNAAGALAMLASPATASLLASSLGIAAAVTAIALLVGVPLGLLLGRTDVRARGLLLAGHAFPLFVPPFLIALGWFHVFGTNGIAGSPATARVLFSGVGVTCVLGLTFAPIVTSLTAIALRSVDPSLEEAARVVAKAPRTALRVLIPIAWPAIALGLLLVFALALSELAVPMFLRVRTYPAGVFARLGGIDYAPGEAVALALPLLALTLALVMVELRVVGRRTFAVLGLRSHERAVLGLGRWRIPATLLCAAITLVSIVPLLALAVRAVPDGVRAVPEWIRASLWTSLLTASGAATVITALGLTAAWALARGRAGGRLLDGIFMLGFLTPSAVLGVGLIAAWNHEWSRAVYGGSAILVLGLVARYAIIGMRVTATAMAQSPRNLEEAAAVFGAGRIRTLRRIVAPLHAREITAAWLLTLIFCLRDLDTVVLFYPPGREPLTVRIFTLEANGPEALVAALAITQIVVTAALLAATAGATMTGRRRPV